MAREKWDLHENFLDWELGIKRPGEKVDDAIFFVSDLRHLKPVNRPTETPIPSRSIVKGTDWREEMGMVAAK